jgi:hypothetical protein
MTGLVDRFKAAQRRRTLREQAVAYKGGRCLICGYDRCASAFDFHHVTPWEKDFAISARMTSFRAIRRELDKCVLLCANCHREVHDGMHPGYLEDPDSYRGQYDVYDLDADPEPLPEVVSEKPDDDAADEDGK